jgi:hypothetical protein
MRQSNFENDSNLSLFAPVPCPNGFSLTAFLKASHRMRTMCLISGNMFQRFGRLKAFVISKQIIKNEIKIGFKEESL